MTLRNSTVSGNAATFRNGISQGGGIAIIGRASASVRIDHSTITDNEASGLANLGYSGSVAISGTVVGDNYTNGAREACNFGGWDGILGWEAGYNAMGPGCGPYLSTSFSLEAGRGSAPCCGTAGPPKSTYRTETASWSITSASTPQGCASPGVTSDQRGWARPQGEGCDIGAVEREPVDDTAPSVTVDQADGQSDPTSRSPIAFTATFSERVTGFDATHVDLSASTAGGPLEAAVSDTGDATPTPWRCRA